MGSREAACAARRGGSSAEVVPAMLLWAAVMAAMPPKSMLALRLRCLCKLAASRGAQGIPKGRAGTLAVVQIGSGCWCWRACRGMQEEVCMHSEGAHIHTQKSHQRMVGSGRTGAEAAVVQHVRVQRCHCCVPSYVCVCSVCM